VDFEANNGELEYILTHANLLLLARSPLLPAPVAEAKTTRTFSRGKPPADVEKNAKMSRDLTIPTERWKCSSTQMHATLAQE